MNQLHHLAPRKCTHPLKERYARLSLTCSIVCSVKRRMALSLTARIVAFGDLGCHYQAILVSIACFSAAPGSVSSLHVQQCLAWHQIRSLKDAWSKFDRVLSVEAMRVVGQHERCSTRTSCVCVALLTCASMPASVQRSGLTLTGMIPVDEEDGTSTYSRENLSNSCFAAQPTIDATLTMGFNTASQDL